MYMYNVNSCQCAVNSNDVVKRENYINKKKTLILYWATWCSQCKPFMKTWDELKEKYSDVDFIDIEHSKMSQIELSKINGFPTIFYVDGDGNETKIKQRNNIPNEIGL